ncbi:plasmid stabilization protein [Sphingomonas sp. H39-1-10]|uniref:plasmid stabilization protein n=1 Tax=Sphingomonas pollutisoli TaxID=3030829 RepID=UPI0023B991E6|nr:plasmid stabilization protein [Sphingomonas pollutisoli]MDF0487996.1 plasmid stabilization protein [Sphingomonas pollutisoli]
MPRGDKDAYTDKQKRKAEHIEESYEDRGVSKKEAEARAWATVNKESGGGNKSGSGRGKPDTHVSSSRGGKAHASGSAEQRSAAARKGWVTRRKNAGG